MALRAQDIQAHEEGELAVFTADTVEHDILPFADGNEVLILSSILTFPVIDTHNRRWQCTTCARTRRGTSTGS